MRVESQAPGDVSADVLVVPIPEGGDAPAGADERVEGLLASGEAGSEWGALSVIHGDGTRLAVAGLGRRPDADAVRTAVAHAARETRRVGGTLAYFVNPSLDLSAADQADRKSVV